MITENPGDNLLPSETNLQIFWSHRPCSGLHSPGGAGRLRLGVGPGQGGRL